MTKPQFRELRNIRDGMMPSNMRAEKLRVALKKQGLVWRKKLAPWQWYLTEKGRRVFK